MNDPLQVRPSSVAVYATKPEASRGRLVPEPPSPTRTEYQRDRDRIIHSGAFRKLRNKTQVFIENEGDYYRTRLTHSLEVAQIARSVSRALGLDDDLAETIALAHDLGHTCFGHAGEEALAEAMQPYGGFNHNEQTFRILTRLEKSYARFDGLNLTWETLEGVVKHNGPISDINAMPTLSAFCTTWDLEIHTFAGAEAQVAAIADDAAYNSHDIDDGYRSGLLRLEDISELPLFGPSFATIKARYPEADSERLMHETVREVIGLMVTDLLDSTRQRLRVLNPRSVADIRHAQQSVVGFSPDTAKQIEVIRQYLRENMYRHSKVNRVCAKARQIVKELFDTFMSEPQTLPNAWAEELSRETSATAKARLIADYIAGMTDRFAAQEHQRLFSTETMI